MNPSKLPTSRWFKLILFIVAMLTLLLILWGNYKVDYYVDALTKAGGWPIVGTPADIGLVYEDVTLTSRDGTQISGWYIPGHTDKAVMLVHGIWGNKQQLYLIGIMLVEAGYHVLTIDLRGHGQSGGKQLTYGYYEAFDVQAGVDYLLARSDIEHVGLIGYSYGGSAVARAASLDDQNEIEALVIQSSFSSMSDAIDDSFTRLTRLPSWPLAPLIVYKVERKLGVTVEQVDSKQALAIMSPRPVLIIHGENDEMFPVHQAHKLYKAAQEPKTLWVIEGAGHGFAMDRKLEYRDRVLEFFEVAFVE